VFSDFKLPFHSTHYPLGFPLKLATNSDEVVLAAREGWGRFSKEFFEKPVELDVGVLQLNDDTRRPVRMVRSRRHLLSMVANPSDFACCDLRKGFGFAWLAPTTASNHAHVRYYYLEAMAYMLLQSLYLTPIHGACVALNGRGLLLCGDSEAGKSSLAYACARRGWVYVSDDASYLVRSSERNVVIGNRHVIRLRESGSQLFPELRDHPITVRAQGDRAIELVTAKQGDLITAPHTPIEYVIFLRRQETGSPKLAAFSKEKALWWLESSLCFGEAEVRAAQTASLRRLLSVEVLQFRYSQLDPAVAELKSLVNSGRTWPAAIKARSNGK
jgi:hypothetical protein